MKISEIKIMDNRTLDEKLLELRKELIKINAQIAIGTTPKNPGQVKNIKKTIARIMGIKETKSGKSIGSGKIKKPEAAAKQVLSEPPSKNSEVGEIKKISGPPRKNSEVKKKHE